MDKSPQDPITRVSVLEHTQQHTEYTLLIESWDPDEEYYHARVAVADIAAGQLWHTWVLGRGHECTAIQEGNQILFQPDGVPVSWMKAQSIARTLIKLMRSTLPPPT
jgi:hypothetical protein